MTRGSHDVLRHLRRLAGAEGAEGLSDNELLGRFIAGRDEGAFGALVCRYGPLVLRLCRQMLADAHDAEDAFQATFLVLVRRAHAVGRRELLANWLYGVAYRVAARLRAHAARRRTRERHGLDPGAAPSPPQRADHDLREAVHEEVQRLPEKYRLPVVLCYLQGKTCAEAAGRLGCPRGTVMGRLARARDLLRRRLRRRGVGLPAAAAALLAGGGASGAVPGPLAQAVVRTAALAAAGWAPADLLPAGLAGITQSVERAMSCTRWKLMSVLAVLLCVIGGVGLTLGGAPAAVAERPWAPQPAAPPAKPAAVPPPLALHHPGMTAFALSPKTGAVATAGERGVRLWQLATGKELRRMTDLVARADGVAFGHDCKRLVSCCDGGTPQVLMWDIDGGKRMVSLADSVPFPALTRLASAPNGELIAWGTVEGWLMVRRASNGEAVSGLGYQGAVTAIAFSRDSKYIAAAFGGLIVVEELGKVGDKRRFNELPVRGAVPALAFTPDGKSVVSGGGNGRLILWDIAARKPLRQWDSHSGAVRSLAFLPDGALLSGGADGSLRLWDVSTAAELRRWQAHAGGVLQVTVTADGKLAASAGADGRVLVWAADLLREGLRPSGELTAARLEELWAELEAGDAGKSLRAMAALAGAPAKALPFLAERLKPAAAEVIPAEVAALIKDLDARSFAARDKAMRELEKRGKEAERFLRLALKAGPPLEAQRRLQALLQKLGPATSDSPLTPQEQRGVLAVRVLEHVGTAEARRLLERLAGGAPEAEQTQQARSALGRLPRPDDKSP